MIYIFWPETARLSLEEIAAQFGEEVAVNIHDMSAERRAEFDKQLQGADVVHMDDAQISVAADTMINKSAAEYTETKSS